MDEHRRFTRSPLRTPVTFTTKGGRETLKGVAKDISVGGMFIETETAPAFGSEVIVRFHLPDRKEEMVLPALVRWTGSGGMGLQFGLLGARETHAITEVVRKAQGS